MRRLLSLLLLMGCIVSTAAADRVTKKDGTSYEGTIVLENDKVIQIETADGKKTIRRSAVVDIERGTEAAEEVTKEPAVFAELSPAQRQIANAEAEYRLGRYESIVQRVEPLIHEDDSSPEQMTLRWLLVDAYERLARFQDAEAQLQLIDKIGPGPDKLRAQAHLDIFKQNDGYRLEKINDRLSRDFLSDDLRLKGKEKNALADRQLMELALTEYVEQILRDEKAGLQSFRQALDVEATVAAIGEMPPAGRLEKYLPYHEQLVEVEKSIDRAAGILPTYTRGFALDLVRTEAQHLSEVIDVVFRTLIDSYPDNFEYAFDPASGKLTKEGREMWRENCQTFLDDSKPLEIMGDYLLKKLQRYPRELRRMHRTVEASLNLLKEMREAIQRKKDSRLHV